MNVEVIDIIVAYLTLRDSLDGIVVKKKSSMPCLNSQYQSMLNA